jgi:hypothetical protein
METRAEGAESPEQLAALLPTSPSKKARTKFFWHIETISCGKHSFDSEVDW